MLTRDSILAASRELPSVEVDCPEWGGTVFVRTLTAGERDRFEVAAADSKRVNFRARLAVATVCDPSGARIFTDADVHALGALPCPPLVRVCEAAIRLNKFSEGDVAELEKNSSPAPAGGP